jgi:hypothetical protein
MSFKKGFFTIALLFVVSVFGFSYATSFGVIGTYNPFNPSFWTTGFMFNTTLDYSGNSAHFFRIGMTAGQTTVAYEKENPFTSKHEMTEYWQRGFYFDYIVGYAWQVNLIDILALHLGADYFMSFSYAYLHPDHDSNIPLNIGLTGLAGLALFPKRRYVVNIDACPGFTLNPLYTTSGDLFAFILPIRLTVGINFGNDVK